MLLRFLILLLLAAPVLADEPPDNDSRNTDSDSNGGGGEDSTTATVGGNDNDNGSNLALVASSPFRMVIGPTPLELDFVAMQSVQRTVEALLMWTSTSPTGTHDEEAIRFLDAEVVLQQVEYVELGVDPDDAKIPTTRIRFFVLATTDSSNSGTTTTTASTTKPRRALDELIETAFNGNEERKQEFLKLLRSEEDSLLDEVDKVVVRALVPSASDSEGDSSKGRKRKLSTADIVLIVVSGAIFVGIAYMVIQHNTDRGYIENLRLLAFNAPPPGVRQRQGDDSYLYPYGTSKEKSRDGGGDQDQDAPSTPSTTNSAADNNNNRHNDTTSVESEENYRPVRITAVTTSPPASSTIPIISAARADSSPVRKLAESFDNNLFHRQATHKRRNYGDGSSYGRRRSDYRGRGRLSRGGGKLRVYDDRDDLEEDEPEYDCYGDDSSSSNSSSGESSEDVFHIDAEGIRLNASNAELGEARGSSKASSTASTASAISEWMKTIRVVPSSPNDAKTARTGSSTTGSNGQSSKTTEPSLDQSHTSSNEQSSLEQFSLEQSMASSSVDDGSSSSEEEEEGQGDNDGGIDNKIMEV